MIFNINARVLGNNAVFVQYQEDGKAKDAAFINWQAFMTWLQEQFCGGSACMPNADAADQERSQKQGAE